MPLTVIISRFIICCLRAQPKSGAVCLLRISSNDVFHLRRPTHIGPQVNHAIHHFHVVDQPHTESTFLAGLQAEKTVSGCWPKQSAKIPCGHIILSRNYFAHKPCRQITCKRKCILLHISLQLHLFDTALSLRISSCLWYSYDHLILYMATAFQRPF